MKKVLSITYVIIALNTYSQTPEYKYETGSSYSKIPSTNKERKVDNGNEIRFQVSNVNPFIYDVTIEGKQIDFEIDTDLDSLKKFTKFIFPELGGIIASSEKETATDKEQLEFFNELNSKDNEMEKIAKEITNEYEKLKEIFEYFKKMGYANLKLQQVCEFAETKEALNTEMAKTLKNTVGETEEDKIEQEFLNKQEQAATYLKNIKTQLETLKNKNEELKDTEEKAESFSIKFNEMNLTGNDPKKGKNSAPAPKSEVTVKKHNYDDFIKECDDNVKAAQTGLDSNYNELFLDLNGTLLNIKKANWTVTSSPIYIDADEIEVSYTLTPKNNLLYRKQDISSSTVITDFWVNNRWKWFVSAGLGINFFRENNYSEISADDKLDSVKYFKSGVGYTDSLIGIDTTKQYKLVNDVQRPNIGFVVLSTITYRCSYGFSIGANFGTMIDLNAHLKFLAGPTFSFGSKKRLNINTGICYGNRKVLKTGYSEGVPYQTSVKDNLPTTNSFKQKPELYFSLTYNISFKRKERPIDKKEEKGDTEDAKGNK